MNGDKRDNIVLHQCEENEIEDSWKNQEDTINGSSSHVISIVDITMNDH